MILPLEFYQTDDVVSIAKSLLGKWLLSCFEGKLTGGMIVETEAYTGIEDRASHAFGGRRTKRTEVMFSPGGVSYVYLCYGIHNLFNVVTSIKHPHAILVRALLPDIGISIMEERRKTKNNNLTPGPGTVCEALGIDRRHTGHPLIQAPVWIEDRGVVFKEVDILTTQRIGVAYAGEDAKLPLRFLLAKQI